MAVVVSQTTGRRSLSSLSWQMCCLLLLSCSFGQIKAKVMELDINGSLNSSVVLSDQPNQEDEAEMGCIDWEGKPVAESQKYIPRGTDLCMLCQCEKRFPILCQSVACSAPQICPNPKLIAGKCCEYECLPGDSGNGGNRTGIGKDPTKDTEENITNLSLRLIASTVTSLLFLALLLFLVYRLRQRRLLLAMRRFEARSRMSNEDTDSEHYIPDNLLALECPPYTDPPPPYSPPKPPHIYHGEQPPAYDEISLAENSQVREVDRTPQMQRGQTPREREVSQSSAPAPGTSMHGLSRHPVETLPAYASTDVVQGLGSMLTSTTPTFQRNWNGWPTDGLGMQTEHRNPFNESGGSARASFSNHRTFDRPSNDRQNMPTVTAFQRFSSLFKRSAQKSKNRNGQARPMSECQPPPQYSTLPRNDLSGSNQSPGSYVNFSNSGRQTRSSSRSATHSFTDRMCFSYDSARAAYELAAMSPSTSSNSSSSGGLAFSSPRGREPNQSSNPPHSQQFQDDLRRHLPPLQTSDGPEGLAGSSPVSTSCSGAQQTPVYQPQRSRNCKQPEQQFHLRTVIRPQHVRVGDVTSNEREASASILYDLTGSLPTADTISSPCTPPRTHLLLSDSRLESIPQDEDCNGHPPMEVYAASPIPQNSLTCSSYPSPSNPAQSSVSFKSKVQDSRNTNNKTPSPPVLASIMRRSQSGVSEVSMFSVCSETGEKKLKDVDSPMEAKVLASDSQYPEHHSLSRPPKSGTLAPVQNALSDDHAEKSNNSMLNNRSSKSVSFSRNNDCPRGVVLNTSHTPASLSASPLTDISCPCDETNLDEEKVVPIGDIQMEDVLYGGFCQENDLNRGIHKRSDDNSSALMSTPLNIHPTSPFVTAQSGQLIPVSCVRPSENMNSIESHTRLPADVKSIHLESKKIKRKKSSKDKNQIQPSPQHHPHQKSSKHSTTLANGSSGSNFMKSDVPYRDAASRPNSKSRSSRGGEKKRRAPSNLVPPLENSDSPAADWPPRSFDDANVVAYGNADVYRSYCCDVALSPSVLPNDRLSLQGHADTRIGFGTKSANGDLPPGNTLPSSSDRTATGHSKPGHGDRSNQPPLTKKKPAHHRRQVSTGDKIPSDSAFRSRQRPKSTAGSADRGHGRRGEPPEFENGGYTKGKGAKSGCGHDLNLDDQMGMIDFFNQGVDYSATKRSGRGSFSNDANFPLPAGARTHGRAAVVESGSQTQHGNSRSGLSSDLSFVNGPCPVSDKGRKRASLPSLPLFSGHSQGVIGLGPKNLMGKRDDRAEREDQQHRNSLPDGSHTRATSYV